MNYKVQTGDFQRVRKKQTKPKWPKYQNKPNALFRDDGENNVKWRWNIAIAFNGWKMKTWF